MKYQFSQEGFQIAFPFHIALNSALDIVGIGNSMSSFLKNWEASPSFFNHFKMERPKGKMDWERLCSMKKSSILIKSNFHSYLNFKGQAIESNQANIIILALLPNIQDFSQLQKLNLTLDDFPLHSPVFDYLFFLQTAKSAAEEAKILAEKAERLARSKAEFLANMSHEIRTPLHAIVGFTKVLTDTTLNLEQQESLQNIDYASDSLLYLVNDILDYSKLEAGKMLLENSPFSLHRLTHQLISLLSPIAEQKDLKLTIDYQLSFQWVKGDSIRLKQVLINLINNALKFTLKGSVKLQITFQTDQTILFEVIDTGIGIAKTNSKQLFLPFTQAESGTTRQFGGTGLGLSISQHIVRAMNGEIKIQSQEGHGSTFFFAISLEATEAPLNSCPFPSQSKIAKNRILVVDDNSMNLKISCKLLHNMEQFVETATSGQEAIDKVQEKEFDIVLMDCQMPMMDGFETTKTIRKLGKKFKLLPIIALTANAFKEDKDKCIAAGMDDFLTKPINMNKLRELIHIYTKKESN